MLRKLQQHPLFASAGEVLADAARYLAIMAVLVMLLGYVAPSLAGAPLAAPRMESYDGSDAIERAWRDGLKPDPLTGQHIRAGGSDPGRFDISRWRVA
ncbi:MAG TPA: hypothetical protein VFZ01_06180 [Geminicoccaceae bacterium]